MRRPVKVVRDYGGEFPATVEGLMTLPGVGRSTAGAIIDPCPRQARADSRR